MIKTMMKEKSSAKHKMGAIQSKAYQVFLRKLINYFQNLYANVNGQIQPG